MSFVGPQRLPNPVSTNSETIDPPNAAAEALRPPNHQTTSPIKPTISSFKPVRVSNDGSRK